MLSYQNFFNIILKRHVDYKKLYYEFFTKNFVGRRLTIFYSIETLPINFAMLLKLNEFNWFHYFINTYSFDGICIGVRKRFFATSFLLRFVAAGVLTDRFFFFFSPKFVFLNVNNVTPGGKVLSKNKVFKKKLYYLKSNLHKRLLAKLYR